VGAGGLRAPPPNPQPPIPNPQSPIPKNINYLKKIIQIIFNKKINKKN
jgi:hypothetical protein